MEKVIRYDDEALENIHFLDDDYYTMFAILTDIENYIAYRKDELKDMTTDKRTSMETLSLLEQLGYPMDNKGTYLYKHLIFKIIKERERLFNNGHTTDEIIINELQNGFSNFYKQTARGDLDIGVKTFHKRIYDAISNVNNSDADPILLGEIFGNAPLELDYAEQALVLAAYISKNNIKRHHEAPKVKKLTTEGLIYNQ